ncbi:hypothetical protein V2S66_31435 [Streptomyces sp. V4-01]|uniref:Uncharacterized protein n=1 Tax=Actinacidiphila polyblastidii TaxID=3110430 RepID=A0ABU7PKV7_9ACTN|nr:hypothetical protein [Streptomyces sp. V4-01]
MAQALYATREAVRTALGSASSARDDAQIDRAIEQGSTDVDSLCNRTFQPLMATRYFDWPSEQTPRSWRLWLDEYDLIAPTQILSAGTVVPSTDYNLEPANDGPPYRYIETRLDRPSTWSGGSTWQHAIEITGWWGYSDEQTPAGQLAAAVSSTTATTVTVSDSSAVGVGDLLTAGAERMTVTDKALADTGQTLQTPVAAKKDDVLFQVADGTSYHRSEVLTLGAERVRVRDIAGSMLTVERAYDGTLLDSHSGDSIWAPRLLTVTRGAAGTTAATAPSGTALTRWAAPGIVQTLTVAEAMNTLMQEQSSYARTVRSQAGTGTRSVAAVVVDLDNLRARAVAAVGRQARMRAV